MSFSDKKIPQENLRDFFILHCFNVKVPILEVAALKYIFITFSDSDTFSLLIYSYIIIDRHIFGTGFFSSGNGNN